MLGGRYALRVMLVSEANRAIAHGGTDGLTLADLADPDFVRQHVVPAGRLAMASLREDPDVDGALKALEATAPPRPEPEYTPEGIRAIAASHVRAFHGVMGDDMAEDFEAMMEVFAKLLERVQCAELLERVVGDEAPAKETVQ